MSSVSIEEFEAKPAAFLAMAEDGQEILIARGGKPVARLVPGRDPFGQERDDWLRLSAKGMSGCYGPDEPGYTEADLIKQREPGAPSEFRSSQERMEAKTRQLEAENEKLRLIVQDQDGEDPNLQSTWDDHQRAKEENANLRARLGLDAGAGELDEQDENQDRQPPV